MIESLMRKSKSRLSSESIGKTLLPEKEVYRIATRFYLKRHEMVQDVSGSDDIVLATKYVADTIEKIYGYSFKIAPKKPKGSWQDYKWFTQSVQELLKTTDDQGLLKYLRTLHQDMALYEYKMTKLGTDYKSANAVTNFQSRKSRSKLRKQQYKSLLDKPVWRLLQVAFWSLVSIKVISILGTDSSAYSDNGEMWGLVFTWLLIGLILYAIYKRIAVYIAFGAISKGK